MKTLQLTDNEIEDLYCALNNEIAIRGVENYSADINAIHKKVWYLLSPTSDFKTDPDLVYIHKPVGV